MQLNQKVSSGISSIQPETINTPQPPNRSKLKIISILLLFLVIISGIVLIALNLKLKTQTKSYNKDQRLIQTPINTPLSGIKIKSNAQGLILTSKGFMIVSNEGILMKDSNDQPKTFLPPGMKEDHLQRFTSYLRKDSILYRNALELMANGVILFIGSTDFDTALKQEAIYEWKIGSTNNPSTLFTNPNGKKIIGFTLSPDKKDIAIIALTRTEKELYEDQNGKSLSDDEYTNRVKQFEEERKQVLIYNRGTGKLLTTFRSNQKIERFVWKNNILFVVESFRYRAFDTNKGIQLFEAEDSYLQSGDIIFSSDGLKFMWTPEHVMRDMKTGKMIANFLIPELIYPNDYKIGQDAEKLFIYIGPATFSNDSTKVLYSASSVSMKNIRFWELDLKTGKTTILKDREIIDNNLFQQNPSWRINPIFAIYGPTDLNVVFSIWIDTINSDVNKLLDLYTFDKKKLMTQSNNIQLDIFDPRLFMFIGWYNVD